MTSRRKTIATLRHVMRRPDTTVRAKRVMSANSPRNKTEGNRYQCVGEMIFCVHEPQYAAKDPSFGYNI
jgi:hypothetical protein